MKRRTDWLRGCATAIVTPFDARGEVDEARFDALVERQISSGVRTIVVCGTTGEGATLRADEVRHVTVRAVRAARDRARVLVGTGGSSTDRVIEATARARDDGADGALVVTPYYNKPTQEGMRAHFAAIADTVAGFPIVLYNVPGRTAANLLPQTVLRLADEHENVVAIKEASGNVTQTAAIVRDRREGFRVLAGDDALTLPSIALGADGVVSVVSNQAPRLMSELVDRAIAGDWHGARARHYRLLPLMEANFLETNPAPVKAALALMGLVEDRLRLPLVPVEGTTRAKLYDVLVEAGLVGAAVATEGKSRDVAA